MLVGMLISFTWWRFHCLQKSSKDMAQDVIYRPWGGTKGLWLCLMAKLIILSCLTLFFCFCFFSLLWLNLPFGTWGMPRSLKFSYKQEKGGGKGGGGSFRGKPAQLRDQTKYSFVRQWLNLNKNWLHKTVISNCCCCWVDKSCLTL